MSGHDLWESPHGRAMAEAIRARLRPDRRRRWTEEELRKLIREEVDRLLGRDFEAEAELSGLLLTHEAYQAGALDLDKRAAAGLRHRIAQVKLQLLERIEEEQKRIAEEDARLDRVVTASMEPDPEFDAEIARQISEVKRRLDEDHEERS